LVEKAIKTGTPNSQVAAVETIRTINAFCRLSKMLYGSSEPIGDDGASDGFDVSVGMTWEKGTIVD
jgi:hypothetical protein